jgi:adenylyltransferase/sulfurtransferase
VTTADRYARHVALDGIGEEGQRRIGAVSVLIIGVGGLGCPAALYLAASGVRRIVLNDFDTVDESNLPRQILFDARDIGRRKAEAAIAKLAALNADVELEAITARLDAPALAAAVEAADIVLDCTDNFLTRLAINAAAVAAGRPLVSGAALRFEGQVAVFAGGGGPCYRCLYSEEDEMLGNCQGNGVLAPVPGVIGTLMASEALQLAARGQAPLASRLQLWDGLHGSWQTIELVADPACPVCGPRR